MLPTDSPATDPSLRLDLYREALRRMLAANGIATGTPEAVVSIANDLRARRQFRVRLLSFLGSMLRREAEPVSALELLALLTSAARGLAVDLTDPALREPLGELLNFVLEAEAESSQGNRPSADAQVRRPRRHLRAGTGAPRSAREPLPEEDFSSNPGVVGGGASRRRTQVQVALFCIVFGLAAGLLFGGHRRLPSALSVAQSAAAPASGANPAAGLDAEFLLPDALPGAPAAEEPSFARDSDGVVRRGSGKSAERQPTQPSRRDGRTVAGPGPSGILLGSAGRRRRSGMAADHDAAPAPVSGPGAAAESLADLGRQPASLQPASFHPGRGVADTNLIAKALLRGPNDDVASNLLSGAMGLHPSVVAGSAGIMAANTLATPAPAYPAQASAASVQGQVVIEAVVGRDGRVVETRLVSGPPMLRAAALAAVEQWSFRPYLVNGKAAEIATTAVLDFRLGR